MTIRPAVKARSTASVPSEKQPLLEVQVDVAEEEKQSESSEDGDTLSLPADPPSPIVSTTKKTSEGW